MSFSSFLDALVAGVVAPRRTGAVWSARMRLRADLARLAGEPHLIADIGFRPDAVADELARAPWEPVRLRRAAAPAPAPCAERPGRWLEPFSPAAAPRP